MKYLLSANTDVGIRKKENQDSVLVKRAIYQEKQIVLAVLCDGMGGLKKGETASASLVKAFDRWFEKKLPEILLGVSLEKKILISWNTLIRGMNQKICEYGTQNKIQLGTTLTAMLFLGDEYYIAHVGDSRAYELGAQILQLTKDQTLVQREVDQGLLKPDAAETDSRRSVLLQCVGASENVEPAYIKGHTVKEAVYLLCCDGFRHLVSAEEIYAAFYPQKMLDEELLNQAGKQLIQLNKERGEQDNLSVIAIRTW